MSAELKPCPLCGSSAELWGAHPDRPARKAWIACVGRCCIMTREYLTDAEAIAAWNARATDAEITSLEEENARIREALDFYAKDHPWPNDGPWGAGSSDFGKAARAALSIRGEG